MESSSRNIDNDNYNVEYLKKVVWSNLTLENKIAIKTKGRPTPQIEITQVTKTSSRVFKRVFKNDIYDKTEWICGCNVKNRLFCFPCLIFERNHTKADQGWVKNGIADLSHLSQKIKKHEHSELHLRCKLELKLLGKHDIRQQLDSAYRKNIENHNAQVKKNRYVLSKIIDCIKFCGAFELALRGHNETEDSLNPGVFKGLVNFSSELDQVLKDHLQTATVFKGTSKTIQNELLQCMFEVLQEHIKAKSVRLTLSLLFLMKPPTCHQCSRWW